MLVLLRPLSRATQQKLPLSQPALKNISSSRYPACFGARTHSLLQPQIPPLCRSSSSTSAATPTPTRTPAQTYTPRTMPLPRSEYLSDVWKDGIFGTTLVLPKLYPPIRLANRTFPQTTKSSSAPVATAPSAAPKCVPWCTWARTPASSGATWKRQRAWPRIS